MSDDGEYELLPHEELEELRRELHKMKRNPLQGYKEADDLKSSIDKLNSSITNLITLFTSTNDELIDSFKKSTLEGYFAQISSQNEKIAQGILAVAKLVDNSNPQVSKPPRPSQESFSSIPPNMETPMPARQSQPLSVQAPSFSEPEFPPMDDNSFSNELDQDSPHFLNDPMLNQGLPSMDLPPPPEKKKGLLGMFK